MDSLAKFERTTTIKPSLIPDSLFWNYGNGDSLWIYNTETESLNGQTTYEQEGTYKVTLREYHKTCTQEKRYNIEVIPNIDVSITNFNNTNADMVVFPNPTSGQLRIKNHELKDDEIIKIYDIMGRTLHNYQFSILHSQLIIDISHLPLGIYYLKIAEKTIKFIKSSNF